MTDRCFSDDDDDDDVLLLLFLIIFALLFFESLLRVDDDKNRRLPFHDVVPRPIIAAAFNAQQDEGVVVSILFSSSLSKVFFVCFLCGENTLFEKFFELFFFFFFFFVFEISKESSSLK